MKNKFSATLSINKPKTFFIGTVISVAVSAVLILIFAFVLTLGDFSASIAFPLSSIALGVGAFVGSLYCAKKIREKGYLCGIIIALSLIFINALVSVIMNGFAFSGYTAIRALIVFIMALLGGIIGINGKSSARLVK